MLAGNEVGAIRVDDGVLQLHLSDTPAPADEQSVVVGVTGFVDVVVRRPIVAGDIDRVASPANLEEARAVAQRLERLPFDGLLIATGATPRKLGDGPAPTGLYTLRTLDDCLAIRADLERSPRVAVVGAGFIGAEVAATCRQRGLEVTLIEALPVPLEPTLGADVGAALAALHRDHGVELQLGVGVEGFEGSERVEAVHLGDGKRIAADLVVVGIGVSPETDWLEGSGVALDDGVLCDPTCASSVSGVVAAGDVARWHNPVFDQSMRVEHWTNATEQARAAAARLLVGDGEAAAFESVPFVWSNQYDLKIQSAGLLSGADEAKVVHGSLDERRFVKLYARKGRLVGALAWNEPRRLLGFRRQIRQRVSWEQALEQSRA